jgi:hypothetical protein
MNPIYELLRSIFKGDNPFSKGRKMLFKHIVAYNIEGISSSSLQDDLLIYESPTSNLRATLTTNPDPFLYIIDRGLSLATLLLRGIFGSQKSSDLHERIENEIDEIRGRRNKKIKSSAILIVETSGEIDTTIEGPRQETEDFILCFDAIDKDYIKAQDQDSISVILTSLILSLGRIEKVQKIRDGVFLVDNEGKVIHSLSASAASAGVIISGLITAELQADVHDLIPLLLNRIELNRVIGLFMQSLDRSVSNLKSFISGWSALEIFINKVFRDHSTRFLEDLYDTSPSLSVHNFLDRISNVMKDKYSLVDKFNIVSHSLGGENIEEDIELFKSIKKTRDLLFHGQDIDESNLPVEKVQLLFLRYLGAELRSQVS